MIDATRIRPLVDFIRHETSEAREWFNSFPEQSV